MKFSYRLIGSGIFLTTLVGLYLSWGAKWSVLPWSPSTSNGGKHKHNHSGHDHAHHSIQKVPGNVSLPEALECHFSESARAVTEMNTMDLLKQVDLDNPHTTYKRIGHDPDDSPRLEGPLEIIVVPHSHCDPGWHKTVEQYFQDQTKHTLNNMVDKLLKYPNMTFIWAETVFLSIWWKGLDDQMKQSVKKLIDRKQLEIVVGSWVVPDEANPHFFAIIDQMIEGHQWLEKHLGIKPTNTWSLDPFGYSSTLPYLYKRAGYENMVILRVYNEVKARMQKMRGLEFMWRQPWDIDGSTDIQTQLMPYMLYNIKHTCGPDHNKCLLFDFRKIPGEVSESRASPINAHNVERLTNVLLEQYHKKSNLFRHNVLLIPIGDDFRFDRSIEWDQQYENYQKLFDYMNSKPALNVHARFGTVSDYFDELKKVVTKNGKTMEEFLPTLQGDFYPYSDQKSEFWAGYFTTRPDDKNLGRVVESHLRAAEILNSLAVATATKLHTNFPYKDVNLDGLSIARQALGLFQHHDAITGTARAFVAKDYEDKLKQGLKSLAAAILHSVEFLLTAEKPKGQELSMDLDDAKSLKLVSENPKFIHVTDKGVDVTFFNTVGKRREELVHLLVDTPDVMVACNIGKIITNQISPVWTTAQELNPSLYELVFAVSADPLALVTYTLTKKVNPKNHKSHVRLINAAKFSPPETSSFTFQYTGKEQIVLENQEYRARFSPKNGYLTSITTKSKIQTTRLDMQFLMYKSAGSGAYIFKPSGPAVDTEFEALPVVRVITGPVFSEVHSIQQTIHHTVRLMNSSSIHSQALEIDNRVDVTKMANKELIMRISSEIENKENDFYSDLNGFQMMHRKKFKNFPLPANYYPMTSHLYIEDSTSRLSLLSAQPLGVTSLETGQLEVMLDRYPTWDDGRGLGEGVYDQRPTPSRFYLLLERRNTDGKEYKNKNPSTSFPTLLSHTLSNDLQHPVFHILHKDHSETLTSTYVPFSPLPCDVNLVNLRLLDQNLKKQPPSAALILHRQGYDCSFIPKELNCPMKNVGISVKDMFKTVKLGGLTETTLSLMHVKESHPLDKALMLKPMEIYAYNATFQ